MRPKRILLISRTVSGGSLKDVVLDAWLVGQEDSADGYKIVIGMMQSSSVSPRGALQRINI
jgi:hypothetical protein